MHVVTNTIPREDGVVAGVASTAAWLQLQLLRVTLVGVALSYHIVVLIPKDAISPPAG